MKINKVDYKPFKTKQEVKKNKSLQFKSKTLRSFVVESPTIKYKQTKEGILNKEKSFYSFLTKKDVKDKKGSLRVQSNLNVHQNKVLNYKNDSFFAALVKIDAFIGDTYLRSHFSQNSLTYASRNNKDIYEIQASYTGLKRALQFLRLQKNRSLIFVGNPGNRSEECKAVFARHNVKFFPSDQWVPGFISKNTNSNKHILVVYDINSNTGAKDEALASNLPIVGFITKYGNTDGLDYPVCLNFENCGSWYSALWNTFLMEKLKKRTSKK